LIVITVLFITNYSITLWLSIYSQLFIECHYCGSIPSRAIPKT